MGLLDKRAVWLLLTWPVAVSEGAEVGIRTEPGTAAAVGRTLTLAGTQAVNRVIRTIILATVFIIIFVPLENILYGSLYSML
jgi:hypothetical protein